MSGENEVSRRQFLAAGLLVACGVMIRPAFGASCSVTPENPRGPFYLPDAPFRSQLAPADLPGERLRISGRVLAAGSCAPLAGAVVDVWHASSGGYYYGLEATPPLKDGEYLLRGRIRTGADGGYAFATILPGNYRVSETHLRPRHIHYTVSHPSHPSLTTQLYFAGDPQNAVDPLVQPALIIPLTRHQEKGAAAYAGTFDIILP